MIFTSSNYPSSLFLSSLLWFIGHQKIIQTVFWTVLCHFPSEHLTAKCFPFLVFLFLHAQSTCQTVMCHWHNYQINSFISPILHFFTLKNPNLQSSKKTVTPPLQYLWHGMDLYRKLGTNKVGDFVFLIQYLYWHLFYKSFILWT